MTAGSAAARDYPFYRGWPTTITVVGWMAVIAGCVAGFAALVAAPRLAGPALGPPLGAALFVGLPLLGLFLAAGRGWTAIFPRPTWRDVGIGLAFVPVTLAVSGAIAVVLINLGLTAPNPVDEALQGQDGAGRAVLLMIAAVQLMGEELVTILPFLAVLTLMSGVGGLARGPAVVAAWVATALMFGALHLPTYQWHVAQALLVIGGARLALTAPFLITKNVWASFTTHLVNDMSVFGVMILAATLRTT